MTKMKSDAPTVWDMLTHDENMEMPKKPTVPYGLVLNPDRAQAERKLAYERQKIEAKKSIVQALSRVENGCYVDTDNVQYVLPIFEGM